MIYFLQNLYMGLASHSIRKVLLFYITAFFFIMVPSYVVEYFTYGQNVSGLLAITLAFIYLGAIMYYGDYPVNSDRKLAFWGVMIAFVCAAIIHNLVLAFIHWMHT